MTNEKHYSSLRKCQKVQGDGKNPKRKEKGLKAKVWIPRLSNFQKFWSLFGGERCGISKGRLHYWTIGGNGVVNLKGIKEGVVNT